LIRQVEVEVFASHGWGDGSGEVVDDGFEVTWARVGRGKARSGEGEFPIGVSSNRPSVAVEGVVVHRAEQDQVDRDGIAAVMVFAHMVCVE
jgi:hypothetical protein